MRISGTLLFSVTINLTAVSQVSAQPAFLQEANPGEAIIKACFAPDMTDPVAIYDCLALGSSLNSIESTDECRSIDNKVGVMVREAYKHKGVSPVPSVYTGGDMTDDSQLPTCAVEAQVIYEVTGEEPYWTPCLGYDPATKQQHFKNCVIAYFQGRERRDETSATQRFQAAGCDELKRFYYEFALPAAYKVRESADGIFRRLPENIEDIDCLEIAAIEF